LFDTANALIKPAARVNAAIGTDVAAARFQSIIIRLGGHSYGVSNLLFGRVHFDSRWIEFFKKLDVVQEVRIMTGISRLVAAILGILFLCGAYWFFLGIYCSWVLTGWIFPV
jgi:hypothetical protein